MNTAELYDLDFAQWAEQNAELPRKGRFAEVDSENIAEEIEDLAKSKRSALGSRITSYRHLLKWQFQAERRGSSWERAIFEQRRRVNRLLAQNPSLRPLLEDVITAEYRGAAKGASIVTGRPRPEFPETCPYTTEQLLDEDFLP